jgi:predicted MPP superfamily phosphohydrolase
MITLKYFIFYTSWLAFPLLYIFIKNKYYFLIFLALLFIYARFIEPKILLTNHYKIQTGFKAKYVLISDIHLGIYNSASILDRTVNKINTLDVDAVLIAGDFTYEAKKENLETLFHSFKNLHVPIYAVLGNHDCERPGHKIRDELVPILEKLGVQMITNKVVELKGITILGLGSHWAREDDVSLLKNYTKDDKLIVLTHNPDTVLDYSPSSPPILTLSGHTHGGQIRIPYIYKKVIPVRGEVLWNQGLYHHKGNKVFVTSGIGTIGLPMRFLIPPTIDVLELY